MKKKTYTITNKYDLIKIFRKLEKRRKIKNICYNIFISMIFVAIIILIGLCIAIIIL